MSLFLLQPYLPDLASLRHMLKRACFFGTHAERRGEGGPGRCLGKPLGSFIHIVAHVSFLTLLLKNPPDWKLCADLVLKLCAPFRSTRRGGKKREREWNMWFREICCKKHK